MSYAPSSFRDPDARLLADEGPQVRRALSAAAAAVDARLRADGVLAALERDAGLIASRPCTERPVPDGWAALIESPRLPFVSEPCEWSFGMLRDAALLTLRLAEQALAHGAILKDGSAFNVLFEGAVPLFVDVASLTTYAGGAWFGYGQFCDHFLAPLLLEAYKGVRFQPFLRSRLEGVSITGELAPLLAARDLVRRGVLTHVVLRAWLDRYARRFGAADRRAARQLPLTAASLRHNLQGLQRLIGGLASRAGGDWSGYDETRDDATTARKSAFVEAACARLGGGRLAWDVGANTGRYSRILARHHDCVVALDADAGAVDRLYRALRDARVRTILPLVVDVMDPTPARGWRGRERAGLWQRGRPDLALYLAIVHHLCLGRGVPLDACLDLVRESAPAAVVEFVAADDPMSQLLLAGRDTHHADYDLANFRRLAAERFTVLAEEAVLPTRHLFLLATR